MFIKKYSSELLLVIIMLVAAILRFYNFFQLPFSWDELSAWNRLHFDSFSDLINQGVKPDGHPAGVQVFLYYWIQLFGDKEWVVKLPFNLMGLFSIFVFYRIALIWWNKNTGLIGASFMASLQFFVLYSPIARPYISGLFLSLLMVYFWSKYIWVARHRKDLLGFVLFAALSAYNHHFSLLFAAIVGLTGLFLIAKNQWKEYLLAGLLIFVLYIPHLPIFFHQLSIGGIGGEGNWLATPSPNFLWEFLYWSFHYSPWLIALVIFISLMGFVCEKRKTHQMNLQLKKRFILFLWFILPIAIGYYYSLLVNPVLQFSMLIFSFPYLLLLLFGQKEGFSKSFLVPMLILVFFLSISTLIISRQHYKLIFKQPYEVAAKSLQASLNENVSAFLLYNGIPSYENYSLKKYNLSSKATLSVYKQDYKVSEMDSILLEISQERLLAVGLPAHYYSLIQQHFPYLITRENAYTVESYLWSKQKPEKQVVFHKLISSQNFEKKQNLWNVAQNRIYRNKQGVANFQFTNQQEWGFSYGDSLKNMLTNYGDIIDVEVEIRADKPIEEALIVGVISVDGKEDIWRGVAFKNQGFGRNNQQKIFLSIDTRTLLNEPDFSHATFKCYIWNRRKEAFLVESINLYQRNLNPIKYALFYSIK